MLLPLKTMLALEEVRVKPVVVPTAKADPTVPLNVQVPASHVNIARYRAPETNSG